jgi:hypothetical protein
MVFGAAPCSAGRKKWRHGAYLGLLPAPAGGESDITELYVARYGEPKVGERVFIRTRQQVDGQEGEDKDISEVVGADEIRKPKAEIRRWLGGVGWQARWGGWGARDAQGSNTVVSPYLPRGSAVGPGGGQEEV